MQRAHGTSLMQSSDAGGFAASWGSDGLMQAGSPLRGVLMQAGWRVSFMILFLSKRNTEYAGISWISKHMGAYWLDT